MRLRRMPCVLFFLGRNGPKINRPAVHALHLVRFPIAHVEGMRDYPRAWLELAQKIWLKFQINVGQEIHGYNRSRGEIDCENGLLADLSQALHACFTNVFARYPHQVDIYRKRDDPTAL